MFAIRNKPATLALLSLFWIVSSYAQAPSIAPLNPDELNFFRHLLITIGDPAHDPQMLKMNEDALATLYGLNQQEVSALHSAGLAFRLAIQIFRAEKAAITAGKATLAHQDVVAISAISSQLDHAVTNITNQMLRSIRPERAHLLRLQGNLVAKAIAGKVVIATKGSR